MKKKVLAIICCVSMLALVGCGQSMDTPAKEDTEDATESAIEEEPEEEEEEVVSDDAIDEVADADEESEEVDPDSIEHIIDYFPEQTKITTIEDILLTSMNVNNIDKMDHQLYYLDCDFLTTDSSDISYDNVTLENYHNILNYVISNYMDEHGYTDDDYVQYNVFDDYTYTGAKYDCSYIVGQYMNMETADQALADVFIISHTSTCEDNQVQVLLYEQVNINQLMD